MPSYHSYAPGWEEPSGGGWSWDDPTSPDAVLEAAGGLSLDAENKRSDLMRRGLVMETGYNPWGGSYQEFTAEFTPKATVTGEVGDVAETQNPTTVLTLGEPPRTGEIVSQMNTVRAASSRV
jgi:hypothetical protein